jgi:N-acyl-L-homoserine lactone synthetase
MPVLLLKIIFKLVPEQAPFILRPLLSPLCWLLGRPIADPAIVENTRYVRIVPLMKF